MRWLQNKITASIFLLIISVPVLLSVKFVAEQYLVQQEAEEKMNTVALQTIHVAKADIVWVRNGKEILVNDKLFDVKHFDINNEMVTLTGFFDTEETELVSAFKKYTDSNNTENLVNESAFQFLFPTVYNSFTQIIYNQKLRILSNKYYSFAETLPVAPSISFIQPPQI